MLETLRFLHLSKYVSYLLLSVSPEDEISVINSDEPIKGYASVAPKLSTNLN